MRDRQISLDVLRILCMCGIIGLHLVNNGGVVANLSFGNLTEYIISFIRSLMYTSVDVFAMLSGFLYREKKQIKYRRILELWIVCLLYTTSISIWIMKYRSDYISNKISLIRAFFPPIEGRYWYIVCYSLLFLLIPYINKLLDILTEKEIYRLLLILLGGLSCVTFLGYDYFRVSYGYSTMWLIVCYIIGAFIKDYGCQLNSRNLLMLLFVLITISSRSVYIYSLAGKTLQHFLRDKDWLVQYNSPLTVTSASIILILASRIKIKKDNKVLSLVSSSTFGVYIIHSHPIIYDYYIKDAFISIASQEVLKATIMLITSIVVIFVVCCFVDIFRMGLFKIILAFLKKLRRESVCKN